MEAMNDALKYVVQAKIILMHNALNEEALTEMRELLEKAEEALVNAK